MKKLVTTLAIILVVVSACNKSDDPEPVAADTSAPVINLKGNTNDTVSLNSNYADPGATANDNTDGDISSKVVVSGTINKDLTGEYRLYYNVKDAAGNSAAQATRYVYVANDADYLEGNYSAFSNCGGSGTGNYTTKVSASTSLNNKISMGIQGDALGLYTHTLTVNGSAMSFQTGNGNYYGGTATIATNKKSITVTLNSGGLNCTNTYTKQ